MVAEGLTRLIQDDPQWQGISVAGREFRLSQFADDTVALLRGALRRFESRLRRYDTYVARLHLKQACAGNNPPSQARHAAVVAPIEGYEADGSPLPRPALEACLAELETSSA